MKTTTRGWFAALLLFCMSVPLLVDAANVSRKKEYNQSFDAKPGYLLEIHNKYGGINIEHWKKDEVAFRVVVSVKANDEATSQELLDRIEIDLEKRGTTLQGNTNIQSSFGGSKIQNVTYDIQYYVNIPSWLDADLDQKYGHILLPDSENKGRYNLTVKYGSLEGGIFTQPLEVDAKYSNVSLDRLTDGDLILAYSERVSISEAENLDIDCKYSNLKLGEVGTLHLEKKYGQINIRHANTIWANLRYSDMIVEKLDRNFQGEGLDYSNVKLKNVLPTFAEIEANSRYGNLTVTLPKSASFKVEAENIKYGSCKISSSFEKTRYQTHTNSAYYEINHAHDGRIYFDGGKYGNLSIKASE